MRKFLLLLLLFAIPVIPVYAETQGILNFSHYNATTGLYGYTVGLCNATSSCFDYKCFFDYDGNYQAGSVGVCNQTSVTNCYHDGSAYAVNTYVCRTNVTYHQCGSSGVWTNQTTCSSGVCVGGTTACSTSGGSGSGSGAGSQSNITVDLTPGISFSVFPSDFEITQGTSQAKSVTAKNSGNQTLYNITLSVAGISWYTVTPSKVSSLSRNGETTFNLSFDAPVNAEVRSYALTFVLNSHNTSGTRALNMKVMPSEQTAQEVIIPDYAKYVSLLAELQSNLSKLSAAGADVEAASSFLTQADNKLKQAQTAIDFKDYANAVEYIDEARGLLNAAGARLAAAEVPTLSPTVLVIILVVIGIAAFMAYLLIPPKDQSSRLSDYFGSRKRKRK